MNVPFSYDAYRKSLTLKYYAKKILYFLRQQNILRNLKVFFERLPEQQSALEGKLTKRLTKSNVLFLINGKRRAKVSKNTLIFT